MKDDIKLRSTETLLTQLFYFQIELKIVEEGRLIRMPHAVFMHLFI